MASAASTSLSPVTQPKVCDRWTDVAAKAVNEYARNGIFIDGAAAGTPGGPWSRLFGEERAASLEKGAFAMLKQAEDAWGHFWLRT